MNKYLYKAIDIGMSEVSLCLVNEISVAACTNIVKISITSTTINEKNGGVLDYSY